MLLMTPLKMAKLGLDRVDPPQCFIHLLSQSVSLVTTLGLAVLISKSHCPQDSSQHAFECGR